MPANRQSGRHVSRRLRCGHRRRRVAGPQPPPHRRPLHPRLIRALPRDGDGADGASFPASAAASCCGPTAARPGSTSATRSATTTCGCPARCPSRRRPRRPAPRPARRHRGLPAPRLRLHRVYGRARPARRRRLRAGCRRRGRATPSSPTTGDATSSRARATWRCASRARPGDGRPRRALPPRRAQHGRPGRPLLPALRRRRAAAGRARALGRRPAGGQRDPGRDAQRWQHPRARGDPRAASASASRTRRWRPRSSSACRRCTSCCRRAGRPSRRSLGPAARDDLHDPGTWRRYGWGPFAPRRAEPAAGERDFVLRRPRAGAAVPRGHARPAAAPCPVPVLRARRGLPADRRASRRRRGAGGQPPRFDARTRAEQDLLFEPGDGRVTRLEPARLAAAGAVESADSGYAETTRVFFGSADHHGLYADPAFQSQLLRLLLRGNGRPRGSRAAPDCERAAPRAYSLAR